ncbi:MAG TPA: M15 family metallopeptidase [Acidimicrobiales bacterium]
MRRTQRRPRDDRGQVVPLAAAMVGLAVIGLMALAPVGRALAARAQARTAADAAALAAAAEGPDAARSVARANRAVLLDIDERDGEVVVRVEVEGVTARARARRIGAAAGSAAGSSAGGDRAGLSPAMRAALARADALLGHPVPVVSGLRTRAEQQALWDRRHANRYPVARPGTSDHERGMAIDVPASVAVAVAAVAPAAGLCRPLPRADPVHFVVCGV